MELNFASAFKKPFTDVKKLIIGILLYILPIVNFLSIGYIIKVGKSEMNKDNSLPEWKEWGDLFVKGLLTVILGFIYAIPAIVLFLIFGWSTMKAGLMGSMGAAAGLASVSLAGPGIIVAVLVGIFLAYIAPSAILHFVKEGKFGAAFKFDSVLKKAFSGKYAIAWIVGMLYAIILGSILGYIPYIGGAISGFISGVTIFSLLGEAFAE